MAALIALVVLLVLFGLGGFAVNVLWYVLIIAVILWLIGFVARPGGGRWYYW